MNGSTVSYTNDTKGNRTSRAVGGVTQATWSWDDRSSLPVRTGEYDQTGSLATAWLADPTSSTGAALAETSGALSSWLLSDPFANVTAVIGTSGASMSGTRSMNAFGATRAGATGSLATSAIGFAGQYLEAATGLYDMRARDYDPASGRFTANDPVAVPTGMPYIAGYSYALNNPLAGTDPSGRWSSNCGALSMLCDQASFGANEIIGAGKVLGGAAAFVFLLQVNPVGTIARTINSGIDSCNAGFAQYGGNGPSFEGFLQCVDNLNPIAGIRNQFGSSLGATNVADSGQAFGQGLAGAALTAAPFAKGILPGSTRCGPVGKGGIAAKGLSALEQGAAKVPSAWGPGVPNSKGVGTRWFDPANPGNGIRIDKGNPESPLPSQKVDHVVVRYNGRVIGPDGRPISGALSENPGAHIPLTDWLNWSTWYAP